MNDSGWHHWTKRIMKNNNVIIVPSKISFQMQTYQMLMYLLLRPVRTSPIISVLLSLPSSVQAKESPYQPHSLINSYRSKEKIVQENKFEKYRWFYYFLNVITLFIQYKNLKLQVLQAIDLYPLPQLFYRLITVWSFRNTINTPEVPLSPFPSHHFHTHLPTFMSILTFMVTNPSLSFVVLRFNFHR